MFLLFFHIVNERRNCTNQSWEIIQIIAVDPVVSSCLSPNWHPSISGDIFLQTSGANLMVARSHGLISVNESISWMIFHLISENSELLMAQNQTHSILSSGHIQSNKWNLIRYWSIWPNRWWKDQHCVTHEYLLNARAHVKALQLWSAWRPARSPHISMGKVFYQIYGLHGWPTEI